MHPCFVFLWFLRPPDPDLARGDGGPPDHLFRGQWGDQLGAAFSLRGEPRVGVFFKFMQHFFRHEAFLESMTILFELVSAMNHHATYILMAMNIII